MKPFYFLLLISGICLRSTGQPDDLVISQIYGGGGNTGAPFSNDFVEIFNPAADDINLSGYSLHYTSATGTNWNLVGTLTGVIGSGKYYLIKLGGGLNGASLPAADFIGTTNLSASSGKLILAKTAISLSGSCPSGLIIIDKVGYGNADCAENTPAPAGSNTLGLLRKSGGCMDSGDNSEDFIASAPNPRNSAAAENSCSVVGSPLAVFFEKVQAENRNGVVFISWTCNESEIETYVVEESINGYEFKQAGAFIPQFNDGRKASYRFERTERMNQPLFFRIRAVEAGGISSYSKIIKIDPFSPKIEISAFPNPTAKTVFYLRIQNFPAGRSQLAIYNMNGKKLATRTVSISGSVQIERIDLQGLRSGIYWVMLEGKESARLKLVVL